MYLDICVVVVIEVGFYQYVESHVISRLLGWYHIRKLYEYMGGVTGRTTVCTLVGTSLERE